MKWRQKVLFTLNCSHNDNFIILTFYWPQTPKSQFFPQKYQNIDQIILKSPQLTFIYHIRYHKCYRLKDEEVFAIIIFHFVRFSSFLGDVFSQYLGMETPPEKLSGTKILRVNMVFLILGTLKGKTNAKVCITGGTQGALLAHGLNDMVEIRGLSGK